MTSIHSLRTLLEQQQYHELQQQCLQQEPEDPAIQTLLAITYLHQGETVLAQQYLQRAQRDDSMLDWATCSDLGAAYMLLLQLDQSVKWLQRAQRQRETEGGSPDSLQLARLGWCRMQQRDLSAARQLFRQSAAIDGERMVVYLNLVTLSLLENPEQGEQVDLDGARQALDQGWTLWRRLSVQWPAEVTELYQQQLQQLHLEFWISSGELGEVEQWLQQQQGELEESAWVRYLVGVSTLLAGRDRHSEAEQQLREGLKYYPENIALHRQLAELAQIQGHGWQAVQLLRRAIVLAGEGEAESIELRCTLVDAALHSSEEIARSAAERAIEQVNELEESEAFPLQRIVQLRRLTKMARAQVESQCEQFEKAEQLFNEILEENPYAVAALRGLGQQKMQCGEIEEAIQLYERIREVDPVHGHSALINARRFPEDEETLEKIEQAAHLPTLQGSVKSGLLFQLAAAWEKRKGYGRAFTLADEANTMSRKLLHYDPLAHRNRCARIRYAFSRSLYQHREGCGYRGEGESLPLFVLGMPRSGTTLVEQIIAGHSRIFGAGELGVIPSRIQGLNRWERHVGSGRSYPDVVDDLNGYTSQGIANGILDELRELAAEDKPGALHVVDKLPHNFENIGLIKFLFPHARIISVRRDPRDIALSNYFTDYQAKHGGMGFAYDLEWIGEQLADHNLLMHHWNQLFPGEILEVHYEHVVENTEEEARRMLEYIGVEWEPQVLAFNKLDRPVKTASVWQVRQPIYKTSKEKWRRYETHLAPLIQGTNAKIEWDLIEMVTLPEPGMLTRGVALYKEGKLDEAEYELKKLLHHIPDHAAANAVVGVIYAQKGHLQDAIELMEKAHQRCPWNKNWRKDLIQAYEMAGELEKAEELKQQGRKVDEPLSEVEVERE